MARAYAEHRFAAVFLGLREAGASVVVAFSAEVENRGQHFQLFAFGKFMPLHGSIMTRWRMSRTARQRFSLVPKPKSAPSLPY